MPFQPSPARPTFIQRLLSVVGGTSHATPAAFQPLEARQMLAATVIDDFDDITVPINSTGNVIELANRIDDTTLNGTVVKFASNVGDIYTLLYNTATPLSVANFLRYVDSAPTSGFSYNETFIHRSVPGFIVQGGGFAYRGGSVLADLESTISQYAPVLNEHIANTALRGTLSYAKLGDNPNSATNQWFFNLANNSSNLDNQNGGFTTFGRVLSNGMTVVDAIAAVPRFNGTGINSAFDNLPLRNVDDSVTIPQRENFVAFTNITRAARVTYTVTVADPTKVSAQIIDGNLSLSYLANTTGSTTVTVTGTSRDGGDPISDTFTVNIGIPTVTTTQASTASVQPGTSFTMTSLGVADEGSGTVASIQYWQDANGDGSFNATQDSLVATATSSEGNWLASIPTGDTASGLYTYFARPRDNDNIFGFVASTQVRINANPTLAGISSSASSALQGQNLDLSAVNAADSDDSVDKVRYYRDINANGTLELDIDTEIGESGNDSTAFRARINTTGFPFGSVTILAQAEDDFDALSNVVATTITILENPPTLTSIRATPALIPNAGTPVVLTGSGFRDRDGTVAGIEYWRDNGDGVFNTDDDTFLGGSTTSRGGFRFEAPTNGFTPGTYTFFGRAVDNSGLFSTAVATTARINAAPVIATLASDAESIERLSFFTLTASGVTDDTTIKSVTFYRDVDGNDAFDSAVDRSIGKARRNADGTYSLRISTKGFAAGTNTFFAVATDANRGVSNVASTTAEVVNAVPTATGITIRPTIVANQGDPLTLTVRGPKDRDGTISLVRYYLDTNNNGSVDLEGAVTDIWLGENPSRSYAITFATTAFQVGANTVLAVVFDNDGGQSQTVSTQVLLNAAPTIGSLTVPDTTVLNGERFTVAAGDVADSDGTVRSVTFYIDSDGNGEFNLSIDRVLGNGRNVNGVWSLTTSVRNVTPGVWSIFARATDNTRGFSQAREGEILVA